MGKSGRHRGGHSRRKHGEGSQGEDSGESVTGEATAAAPASHPEASRFLSYSPPDPQFHHVTVLRDEVVAWLAPHSGGVYADVTLGGGGHSEALLLASAPDGRVLGFDRDKQAREAAARRLAGFGDRIQIRAGRFSELAQLLDGQGPLDGVVADLGVSSPQLDQAGRGFSFMNDGPLDMRMNPEEGESAAGLVNEADEETLRRIFWEYGEERFSGRIASAIVRTRAHKPFTRTRELAELIASVVPSPRGPGPRIHPATRAFQGLRIAVNEELQELHAGLAAAFSSLKPGGRLAVIAFHSLEDRIVKQFFREKAAECVCPPGLPICVCGKVAEALVLTPKPVEAGNAELELNPRARSARLRVAERLAAQRPPDSVSRQKVRTG